MAINEHCVSKYTHNVLYVNSEASVVDRPTSLALNHLGLIFVIDGFESNQIKTWDMLRICSSLSFAVVGITPDKPCYTGILP